MVPPSGFARPLLTILLLASAVVGEQQAAVPPATASATAAQKPSTSQSSAPPAAAPSNAKGSTAPAAAAATPAGQPSATDYSKEGVIIEKNITKVTFEADGTGVRETAVAFRVQSQAGVQELGVLTFAYLSSNESVEFDYIRVRKPDGTVVTTPDYNVQDMPADVTRAAPMYSDVHEKHVTVKALGVGDVLEYTIRYRTFKPQVPGQFWWEYTFTKNFIAQDDELQVTVPRDKYVKVSSPDYKAEIKDEGAQRIYKWKNSNLSRPDPDIEVSRDSLKPSVQLTTFKSWEEVGRWYDELQRPQLTVTPQLKARAAELTKGLTSDDDKMRALYNDVATHFHYVSLSFGVGRYQPHAAEDVLENQYGDCKDKHTLLATLLQAAGIEAWPALINAERKLDQEMPSPGQFNHVITYVPRAGNPLWLDTTPEVAPFGLLTPNIRNKQALVIPEGKPAELKTTPANPPFVAQQLFSFDGSLNAEGTLQGHVKQQFRGDVELFSRLGFRNTAPAQWKELAQRISSGEGFGGEVSEVNASTPDDTSKPFEFSYVYTRKEYSDWANHRIIAPFPVMGVEGWASRDKKPADPVLLGALGELVYTAKITLPVEVVKLPSDVTLTEPYADFHSKYSRSGNILTITRRLQVKQNEVPLASWDNYKKFAKAIADDWGAFVELYGGDKEAAADTTKGDGEQPPAEAMKAGQDIEDALRRQDTTTAEDTARGLIEKYPNIKGVHAELGYVYARQNRNDEALVEFRKEEELHPDNVAMYKAVGGFYMSKNQPAKAEEQYREWLAIDPKNLDAMTGLSAALGSQKKFAERVELWGKASQLLPENEAVQRQLAFAYLSDKQYEKALPLLEKAMAAETRPMPLNDAAYDLADQNIHLDLAKAWGDKALQQLEADSLKSESEDAALTNTRFFGYVWDTVGWIYFRMGDYEKAEAYLRAGFELTQAAADGDHLAQVYQKQGKKELAAHTYKLAYANAKVDKDSIKEHYYSLMGKDADLNESPVTLKRGPATKAAYGPEDELSRARTTKISATSSVAGSATVSVVFSPGKIEDVKFISGEEKLKPMTGQIASSKIRADFPNSNEVRITRRGILVCGSLGCDFTLLLPDAPHATE